MPTDLKDMRNAHAHRSLPGKGNPSVFQSSNTQQNRSHPLFLIPIVVTRIILFGLCSAASSFLLSKLIFINPKSEKKKIIKEKKIVKTLDTIYPTKAAASSCLILDFAFFIKVYMG